MESQQPTSWVVIVAALFVGPKELGTNHCADTLKPAPGPRPQRQGSVGWLDGYGDHPHGCTLISHRPENQPIDRRPPTA
ncbi:hypothetical protein B0T22DRAFT_460128 [Podospora appendiculata]|uniref:Uncharacterized protein n=1 Tax=Podospora appendiculata TaxID=314037 RepID=A0AAE0X9Y4_9PEZI|nr:hypothetical protein B0T22DRAFT_460128 [Podospora appendiculata]